MSDQAVFRAIEFAARAHAGQYRKQTRLPYIIHPLSVARILIEAGQASDVVVAGVLHDVLEDTDATREELERQFGPQVAALVAEVSEEDKNADWQERKRATVDCLATASPEAIWVELADKLDNIRSIAADQSRDGDRVWERFNSPKQKQRWYYESLVEGFEKRCKDPDCRRVFACFAAEVRKVFARDGDGRRADCADDLKGL